MIVEVAIGNEAPRRYQVRREGGRVVVREYDDAHRNGGNPAAHGTTIDWRRPRPGVYSLLIDDNSYEVFIEGPAENLAVHLVKHSFHVRATDVRRHRRVDAGAGVADGVVRITAPIPGRVARVLVQPGQAVSRGDGVVVVEAMKMENELRAPRDGVIGGIEVEEGQGVEGGALLATIE